MNRLAKGLLFAAAAGGAAYGLNEAFDIITPDMFVGADNLNALKDVVTANTDQFKDIAQVFTPDQAPNAANLGGDWIQHVLDDKTIVAIKDGAIMPAIDGVSSDYTDYFVNHASASVDNVMEGITDALKSAGLDITPEKLTTVNEALNKTLQTGSDLVGKTAYAQDLFYGKVAVPAAAAVAGGAVGVATGGGQERPGTKLAAEIQRRQAALAQVNNGLHQNGLA